LTQRPDDNAATVAERLRVYEEKTRPLVDFYRARGLLRVIDAMGDVEEVSRRLGQALGAPALRAARAAKSATRRAPHRTGARGKAAQPKGARRRAKSRSEEHTSELQSPYELVCRLLLE